MSFGNIGQFIGEENNIEIEKEEEKDIINEITKTFSNEDESSRSSMVEIGFKQNIIESLKNYESLYENHLIQMKGFIKMSKLYIEASKELYDFAADELFKNYENKEQAKVELCENRIEIINDSLNHIKKYKSILKTKAISIGGADRLLELVKAEYDKRDKKFKHNLELLRPIFIHKYLDSFELIEPEQFKKKNFENHTILTVIGRRGAGKSSFINAFRNLNAYDAGAAVTDDVECTMLAKFYPFETYEQQESVANSGPKIFLLDFPGILFTPYLCIFKFSSQ